MQDGICSGFPNAGPEDLEKLTNVISDKILSAAEDYRATIHSHLKEVKKGDGFGDDGTTCRRAKILELERR